MSNLILKAIDESLGALVPVRSTYEQNKNLADKAESSVSLTLQDVEGIDLATVDLQKMEEQDGKLATQQGKLREAYSLMQERRKVYTQTFDFIRGLFTAEEERIKAMGVKVKAVRDGWQGEKMKRAAKAREEQEAQLAKGQRRTEVAGEYRTFIERGFTGALAAKIEELHGRFNAATAEELPAMSDKLKAWQPALKVEDLGKWSDKGNPRPQWFSFEESDVIRREVVASMVQRLGAEWAERLSAERDALIARVPARIEELKQGAVNTKQLDREAQERREALQREAEERTQAQASATEADKITQAFEAAAEATPVVGLAKGTVAKKKYVPKTHAAWVALLQNWVSSEMAGCTLEELGKKLSFALTSANKGLNSGAAVIQASGLTVEDDFSTRAYRSRKEEVAA